MRTPSRITHHASRITFYASALLLLCLFAQAMVHARSASLTFDEGPHLAIGYATLRTGDLRLQPVHIHPPLANVLSAVPLLLQHDLPDPRMVDGWEIASLSAITDAVVWQYPHPEQIALAGRFPIILMTLVLGAVVFRWACEVSQRINESTGQRSSESTGQRSSESTSQRSGESTSQRSGESTKQRSGESTKQRSVGSAGRRVGEMGRWAGVVALFLFAFDPNIIAHGSLITTDMAVVLWGTVALFLTWRYLQGDRVGAGLAPAQGDHKGGDHKEGDHKGRPYIMGAGVALGLALGSKVSALALVPVLGLLWLVVPRGGQGRAGQGRAGQGRALPLRWRWRVLNVVLAILAAALTLWAIYGFEVRRLPGMSFSLPAATHIAIYRSLQEHYALGHPAFLLGQNGDRGWWYYFPVAFALKTPLPTLLLLGAAIISGINGSANQRIFFHSLFSNWQDAMRRWGPLVLFPVVYAISSFFSSVNIGYRHLLPLLPFAFVVTSGITKYVLRIAYCVFCGLCCGWLVLNAVLISPDYLTYFNVPDGYRYLVDSNLDWGQNLWQLRDWMRDHGVERVYYAHFSPARPEVYGIRVDMLPPSPRAVPFTPLDPAPGVYAIGATVLQGVYTPDVNTYAWFRAHEPVARLGRALFIYRVKPRPAPAWAALCADPAAVVSPETVRAGLGRADLRVVVFDCRQTWVYPAGEGPGVFVLAPDVEPPPSATLEVNARHADGKPLYALYRIENVSAPEHSRDITMDGSLDFAGYRINGYGYYPGDEIELWTFWRVKDVPARPLSLMAHLTEPDGVPVAVGDGLGVPIEQWQVGDVIVQRSRFPVTEQMAGNYQLRVGAYWLDTMERWPVRDEQENTGDRIILTSVVVLH